MQEGKWQNLRLNRWFIMGFLLVNGAGLLALEPQPELHKKIQKGKNQGEKKQPSLFPHSNGCPLFANENKAKETKEKETRQSVQEQIVQKEAKGGEMSPEQGLNQKKGKLIEVMPSNYVDPRHKHELKKKVTPDDLPQVPQKVIIPQDPPEKLGTMPQPKSSAENGKRVLPEELP